MSNFWKKRIKNKESIANKIGVDSEKIQELMNGEREIEGATLDKVLQAVEEEDMLKPIKQLEILQWYKDTDLKDMREKFGFKSQRELAEVLNMDNSTLCNFEKKQPIKAVGSKLIQLYNFYQNDFNRKTLKVNDDEQKYNKNIEEKSMNEELDKIFEWYKNTDIKSLRGNLTLKKMSAKIKIPYTSLNDVEIKRPRSLTPNIRKVYYYYHNQPANYSKNNEIWKWYKNTDLKELRESYGINQYELSNAINISQPCVSDVELKRVKSVSVTMQKMYEYYMGLGKPTIKEEDTIYDWYKSINDFGEYRRKFGYSRNKFMAVLNLSNDQVRDFEKHSYKSATPIVKKIYEFYHNEENRLPAIEWIPNDNNKWVVEKEETPKAEINKRTETFNNRLDKLSNFMDQYNKLKEENERLKETIKQYEMIIDKM